MSLSDERQTEEKSSNILEVTDLTKYFSQESGIIDRFVGSSRVVKAVDGVDLSLKEGETLAIVGESGCGKSTLAKSILNLEPPTEGSVKLQGDEIAGISEREMRPYRRDIQMIFQDPLASLNPRKTVQKLLLTPMRVHGIGDDKEERVEKARNVLERVGLNPDILGRYPRQFSGGQQQRIALARVLILEPNIIVADEPVSALDVSVQAQILNLLKNLQSEMGLSILLITHDLRVVSKMADRVSVMYLGEIVETAPNREILSSPTHPYTKSLLSSVPRLNPEDRIDRIILEGSVPSSINPPSGCRFHTRCPAVIPPASWDADQSVFKAVLDYRNRLLSGDIDPDASREFLESDQDSQVTPDDIVDHVLERDLKVSIGDVPEDRTSVIVDATKALIEGDETRLKSVLSELARTPCEDSIPAVEEVGESHEVKCHLHSADMPGEPERS